jgi:hypothetical protein
MGIIQMVLYFIYRNGLKSQEPLKMDLEKNNVITIAMGHKEDCI